MKKVIYIITTILLCMTSCTDIHDTYSEYIKDGEQIYVGKLADVKIHPGFQRMICLLYTSGLLVGVLRENKSGGASSIQTSLPARNIGLSGRFTYAYDGRYFVEANFGYNGSERFAKNERFGFFPSIGAGWMISEEKFWNQDIKNIINKLKLKGTYGLVGNDNIGKRCV